MEALLRSLGSVLVPVIELAGALIIVIGVVRGLGFFLAGLGRPGRYPLSLIRMGLGQSMILALEFQVGADILKTALAPDWNSIAQLGAIILLRTVLNYFLSRELSELRQSESDEQPRVEAARQSLTRS